MFEITRLKMIDIIHQCMDEQIRPGDTVCDCTMGNGHDTAYMCRLTGDTGTVYSFDIQPEALSRTEALLAEEHLLTPARLILDSHSHLKQYIDHPIRFFVFNLGYLPDGDPTVITKGTSTLEAIEAALSITETGGRRCRFILLRPSRRCRRESGCRRISPQSCLQNTFPS